jgi:EAL domain-containing protein (putative c-di-GMP-specific phosphodiesterase class I)
MMPNRAAADDPPALEVRGLRVRDALAQGFITLAYQPIVDLHSGGVSGVEAIGRWRHPTLGAISPAHFVALADRTGLVQEFTTWVLHETTWTLAGWQRRPAVPDDLSVSVNLACSTVAAAGFAQLVRDGLDEAGIVPHCLVLELTEKDLVASGAALVDAMWELSHHGVRFALDDFRPGHSSLARLSRLPLSTLKLDPSFFDGVSGPEDPATVVRATLAMASGLGMDVVAKGVQTPAQLGHLSAAGCRFVQGDLTGRPVTGEKLVELLGAEHAIITAPAAGEQPAAQLDALVRAMKVHVQDARRLDVGTVRELLAELAHLAEMESAYLTRVDWAASKQELQVVHNTGALALPEGLLVEWSDTLCRRALHGGPSFTDDVARDYPDSSAAADLGLRSYLTVPVNDSHGHFYGTLCGASTMAVPAGEAHLGAFRLFARLIGEHLPATDV